MKKVIFMIVFLAISFLAIPADPALTVAKVPDLPSGENYAPCIAANAAHDILIFYRNSDYGVVYYFKKHDASGWIGPKAIPGQASHYDPQYYELIFQTGLTATPDGKFHAIWTFDIHFSFVGGMYYAQFDPDTGEWSDPTQLQAGKFERPRLITNPVNGDLLLTYDWYQNGTNKDVFLMVKPYHDQWKKQKNITTMNPKNQTAIATAPHGLPAETDANLSIDPSTGNMYYTYKQDYWNEPDQKWELRIVVALFSPAPNYELLWRQEVTTPYYGWHFMPSIVAIDGQALMAFAWNQERAYHYLTFQENNGRLTYDNSTLEKNRIAEIPAMPHWEFFSQLFTHGDEVWFTYKNISYSLKMMRLSISGKKIEKTPVDLCNNMQSGWPYSCYEEPSIGILSAWHTRDKASVYYSIYDDPIVYPIFSARNIAVQTFTESSFFKHYSYNVVTWENNPANAENKHTITSYKIYRKLKTEAVSRYAFLAEVAAPAMTYKDQSFTNSTNPYDYYVTCVDSEGLESEIK